MIEQDTFGQMPDGQAVSAFILSNANGSAIEILSLGGIIRRWIAPTIQKQDIVLGLDTVEQYLHDPNYFGAVVGRYANRIGHGHFQINGTDYQVPQNQAGHCLHGGEQGFNKRNWQLTDLDLAQNAITLALVSKDGDQGFPGRLQTSVRYQLDDVNCLRIEYRAHCDQDTLYNPTQHSYFNLDGHTSGDIKQHSIQINADKFTPADNTALPTGELDDVTGTAFDLRYPKIVQDVLAADHKQIKLANGLDHNFCLTDYQPDLSEPFEFAKISSTTHDLCLIVRTTMPGAQVYTGNFIGADSPGKSGAKYQANQGLCIETQHYPDAPNKAQFPSALLRAGRTFYSITEYQLT